MLNHILILISAVRDRNTLSYEVLVALAISKTSFIQMKRLVSFCFDNPFILT